MKVGIKYCGGYTRCCASYKQYDAEKVIKITDPDTSL